MIKKITIVILCLVFAIWQISFLDQFEYLNSYANPILLLIILVTVFSGYQMGFLCAFSAGLVLDLYSSLNYGLITLSFCVCIIVILLLYKKLLTRISIYSLSLTTIICVLSYHATLWIISNIFTWLNWHNLSITLSLKNLYLIVGQIIFQEVLLILVYYFFKLINRTLRLQLLSNKTI